MPEVSIITTQQLDTAVLEELVKFSRVVFEDASQQEENISFLPITQQPRQPAPSSHQMNVEVLAVLAQQLYAAETNFKFVLSVPAILKWEMNFQSRQNKMQLRQFHYSLTGLCRSML